MLTSALIATLVLVGINILVYLMPSFVDFSKGKGSSSQAFLELGWKDNEDIKSGEYYRLLTAMFLHADPIHLLLNMYILWIFGSSFPNAIIFLVVFLASGIVGNLFSFFLNPQPSVGASGAIFGLVGFVLVESLRFGDSFNIVNLLIYVAISLFFANTPGSRIDFWGHVGGIVCGAAIGALLLFL
jgi:rhomboid protease GluP